MHMTTVVGWVERSDTHHCRSTLSMGIALLNPSYGSELRP